MLVVILTAVANGAAWDDSFPFSESFQLKEISAQEVMTNANNSPAVYDHVIIKGDLFLDKDQEHPLRITNSVFRNNVSCKGVTFYGDVNSEKAN